MWNFNEFAKKAQELQEQAEQAASTFSTNSGFPLNLDAMQQMTGTDIGSSSPSARKKQVPQTTGGTTIRPVAVDSALPAAKPKPRVITPKGKLQVPAKLAKKKAQPLVDEAKATQSAERSESEETNHNITSATTTSSTPTNESPVAQSLESVGTGMGVDLRELAQAPGTLTTETKALIDDSIDLAEEEIVVEKSVGIVQSDDANVALDFSPEAKSLAASVEVAEPKQESIHEQPSKPDTPEASNSTDVDTVVEDTTATHMEEPEPPAIPEKSLVALISTLDRKSMQRQEFCFTVLKAKKIPYETIDIMDQSTASLKDDLIAISGIPNQYPQFFLVEMATGVPKFWGLMEEFQHANDDGVLQAELGGLDSKPPEPIPPPIEPVDKDHPGEEEEENISPNAQQATEEMLEQFTNQLKRLEENHQIDIAEMEQRHMQEMNSLKDFMNQEKVSNKDLEQQYQKQIKDQENQLNQAFKKHGGYEREIESLKQEIEGLEVLLAEKKSDMGKTNEENLKHLRLWEKKVNQAEAETEKTKEFAKTLEKNLEETKEAVACEKKENTKLNDKIVSLTTDLRSQQIECRNLKETIDELNEAREKSAVEIEKLEFQLSDREKSGTERTEEMEQLRGALTQAKSEAQKLRAVADEKDAKHEKALADFKKKTQGALGMANSRAAAALQSKEEAELEARAARSTADAAMDRVVQAELASKAAVAEAKASTKDMEAKKEVAVQRQGELSKALEENTARMAELEDMLAETKRSMQSRSSELDKLMAEYKEEKQRSSSYQSELADANSRVSLMREEVKQLRDKVRIKDPASSESGDKPVERNGSTTNDAFVVDKSKVDNSSLAILQNELNQANQVIDELKTALDAAVEENEKIQAIQQLPEDARAIILNGNSEPAPLMYAMEKQAEVNVARNEINRLANLLSDAEAEKMDALDATESMRKQMEEAQARLKRFEKLRTGRQPEATESNGTAPVDDSGAINIEYLKNIMLRYLNATSIQERKRLIPVVGAVLCLTPDEQRKAVENLEESVSIGGVGSTLFESFSGNFLSRKK